MPTVPWTPRLHKCHTTSANRRRRPKDAGVEDGRFVFRVPGSPDGTERICDGAHRALETFLASRRQTRRRFIARPHAPSLSRGNTSWHSSTTHSQGVPEELRRTGIRFNVRNIFQIRRTFCGTPVTTRPDRQVQGTPCHCGRSYIGETSSPWNYALSNTHKTFGKVCWKNQNYLNMRRPPNMWE